jgi:hypothetical protein
MRPGCLQGFTLCTSSKLAWHTRLCKPRLRSPTHKNAATEMNECLLSIDCTDRRNSATIVARELQVCISPACSRLYKLASLPRASRSCMYRQRAILPCKMCEGCAVATLNGGGHAECGCAIRAAPLLMVVTRTRSQLSFLRCHLRMTAKAVPMPSPDLLILF